ncbi:MAG: ankyrin repeat domain-containing protein [Candidatus Gastranaerophilales bacterium]|nr:ankyrin repeat domain-containing protein [Candidatus Gastranaerophilales bacterium]
MAGLLFKIFFILCLVFICQSVQAFDSSFPFPFEFGHSSDIYLDVKKETKETRVKDREAEDILKARGIKNDPESFLKYIRKNDLESLKLILKAGFDPNKSINADFPIYYAARRNKTQVVYLLLENGADPNKGFSSPLRCAILEGDYNLAKTLIDHGANINFIDVLTDETILYTALKKKRYDIARILVEKGVKMDSDSYKIIKKRKLESTLGVYMN